MNSVNNFFKIPGMLERLMLRMFSSKTKTDETIKNLWSQFKLSQNNENCNLLATAIIGRADKLPYAGSQVKNIKIVSASLLPWYIPDTLKKQLSIAISNTLTAKSIQRELETEKTAKNIFLGMFPDPKDLSSPSNPNVRQGIVQTHDETIKKLEDQLEKVKNQTADAFPRLA